MRMKSKQRGGTKPWNELWADTVERCWGAAWPQHCQGINRMDLSVSRSTTCSATCQTVSIILPGLGDGRSRGAAGWRTRSMMWFIEELRVRWMGSGSHKGLNKTCLTKPALATTATAQWEAFYTFFTVILILINVIDGMCNIANYSAAVLQSR